MTPDKIELLSAPHDAGDAGRLRFSAAHPRQPPLAAACSVTDITSNCLGTISQGKAIDAEVQHGGRGRGGMDEQAFDAAKLPPYEIALPWLLGESEDSPRELGSSVSQAHHLVAVSIGTKS